MKREDLEKLGLTKEQVDTIMDFNGKDINEFKKQNEVLQASVKDLTTKYDTVNKDFNDFKTSKMTEEEKKQQVLKQKEEEQLKVLNEAKEAQEKYQKLIKETKIKGVLVGAGFKEDGITTFIDKLVGTNEEESVKNATEFVKYIDEQRKSAVAKALEDAARGTPNPESQGTGKNPEPFKPSAVW